MVDVWTAYHRAPPNCPCQAHSADPRFGVQQPSASPRAGDETRAGTCTGAGGLGYCYRAFLERFLYIMLFIVTVFIS